VSLFRLFSLSQVLSSMSLEDSTSSDPGEGVKRDKISSLHRTVCNSLLLLFILIANLTGYQNLISNILKAVSPSDSAKLSMYPKLQLAYAVHDGHYKTTEPRSSFAPPVQLFNPVFGHFLDYMRSNITIPSDTVCRATEYMVAASAIYKDEEKCRAALNLLLTARARHG